MNRRNFAGLIVSAAMLSLLGGCATEPYTAGGTLDKETAATIAAFKRTDPEMEKFFNTCAGYAVFPSVTKGAAGIGAAHGEGEVFATDKLIGFVTMTQVTLGVQLGGQEYSELIFFADKQTLDEFVANQLAFSAQATAVAAAAGASYDADYQKGVAVFTLAKGGLMFEASVGGQKFSFTPLRKPPLY
jgi:lipid-binding SYLF domain-containing protein